MPTALDLQDAAWEDTRGKQGRVRVRDSGDMIVLPFRSLHYYTSSTGSGTGPSLQAGGFGEAQSGFGSAILLGVADDAAGSGLAVRMLIWGAIFGVTFQSQLADADQPPYICTGVDRHYRRWSTVNRWLYYRQKLSTPPFSTFDDYACPVIHATDLAEDFPHLCELIIPGNRAQGGNLSQLRAFGIVVSRRAGYSQPARMARPYSYNLAHAASYPTLTSSDRIKRGEGTSRDGLDVSAIWLNNRDTVARTVYLSIGGKEAHRWDLAPGTGGSADTPGSQKIIDLTRPLAPANDIYLYTDAAYTTNPVVATVITGS